MNLVYTVGFMAQLLFASRTLVQWLASEKLGRVDAPVLFWQLSLMANLMMLTYGLMREDLVIISGQFITYFIYLRNLHYKNSWHRLGPWMQVLLLILPLGIMFFWMRGHNQTFDAIINNPQIPEGLLVLGTIGQVILSFRFVYQWYRSEKRGQSLLPPGFWIISIIGAAIVLIYGIVRWDPVLCLGHLTGLGIYLRNLYLSYNPAIVR